MEMEGVRHKAGELKFSNSLIDIAQLFKRMARLDKSFPTFRPRLHAAVPSLLGLSLSPLSPGPHAFVGSYIYRKFQKQSALQETLAAVRTVVGGKGTSLFFGQDLIQAAQPIFSGQSVSSPFPRG